MLMYDFDAVMSFCVEESCRVLVIGAWIRPITDTSMKSSRFTVVKFQLSPICVANSHLKLAIFCHLIRLNYFAHFLEFRLLELIDFY